MQLSFSIKSFFSPLKYETKRCGPLLTAVCSQGEQVLRSLEEGASTDILG